ncbi:MAG: hypothetical protein ACQEQ2_04655 [Pseudomonadota bacterium]
MKLEVTTIEVKQTAKALATVAAILSAFISVFGLIALAFVGIETSISFNYVISITVSGTFGKTILLLFYPILTFIFAYLTVAVFALLYNYTAKYTGGIKFQSESTHESA